MAKSVNGDTATASTNGFAIVTKGSGVREQQFLSTGWIKAPKPVHKLFGTYLLISDGVPQIWDGALWEITS